MHKGSSWKTTLRCYALATFVLSLIFLLPSHEGFGQAIGDYRTKASGSWSNPATWERCVTAGTWTGATSTSYPGQSAGTGAVTILNGHNVTLDVSPGNAVGALAFADGTTNATSLSMAGYTLDVAGAITFGNPGGNNGDQTLTVGTGTLNCASIKMPETGASTEVLTLSITSGTVNCSGDIGMLTGTLVRNVVDVTGAATINVGGNFTGGTYNRGTSTVNYNGSGAQAVGPYTYYNLTTSTGGVKTLAAVNIIISGNLTVNSSTFAFDATAARTVTVAGNVSGDGTIDMSPGDRTHTLLLGGASNSIGALVTSSLPAATSTVSYNRGSDQTLFASPSYRNLTVSGGGNKQLSGDITLSGTLTLTSGKVVLGASNLTLAGTTAVSGTLSAANHVNASGTGQLKKVFAAGATGAYNLPIGDGTSYTPVSLTLTANTLQRTIGVRVTDAKHTNDASATDYLTRYWNFTDDQAGNGSYTYNATFNYINSPLDVVGTVGNVRVNRWDGSTWTQYTTTPATPTTSITITGGTDITAPLDGCSFTGRVNGPVTYTWDKVGATASYTDPFSWSPARLSPQPTDILLFDNAGAATATGVPAETVAKLLLANGSNVTLQPLAGADRALTISGGSGDDLDVAAGTTLTIGNTGANNVNLTLGASAVGLVRGTLVNAGIVTSTAATLTFDATSTYTHGRNGGAIPTATWNATSTCAITGTTSAAPSGFNQSFGNLTLNSTSLTSTVTATLSGATTVKGNLYIAGTSSANMLGLNLAGNNFTVNGTTVVDDNGQLIDATAGGANLFVGQVTTNALGVWNVSQPSTFRGGLTVDGTFTGGNYTFDTNDQSIDGSAAITIPNIIVPTVGKALTNLKTAGVTVTGTISGVGSFTNGDALTAAVLNVTAASPFTLTGSINLSSNPNTVNYSGTVAQTIAALAYYHLTSSSTGARTLANTGTISINGAFTKGTNTYTVAGSTVNFSGSIPQNIPAFTFNNLTVSGGSTKTLIGAVTVNTTLNLNGAVLELAGYNLAVANTVAGAIVAGSPFSATNMISTSGAGYLQKSAAAAAGIQIVYPVGSGGYYSPVTISSITTSYPSNFQVRAVPSAINPSYIKKYWDLKPSAAVTSATATFTYAADELNGAMPSISFSPDNGTTWQNPPTSGTQSFSGTSFTIAATNALSGWWTMGYRTFYSYQTGSWNVPTSWTSDPSGTLQIGSAIPSYNDRVVVLTGRTITLTGDVADKNLDITIDNGGFLDMGVYKFTGIPTNLLALRGQGTLKLASASFPTAPTNTLVQAGGGTVEFDNAASFDLPVSQTTFNNLTINTATSAAATQRNNLTLFGNLYVKQGTFKINDDASTARRELTVNGNVTVDADGKIAVGSGRTNQAASGTPPFIDYYDRNSHRVVVMGDFTNSGTVRFTNQAYPVYNAFPINGFATVYFQGETNNTLTCNGTTDFYNLVLDKGADQTYSLKVDPSAYQNFRLFGRNSASGYVAAPATAENPNLQKALWIRNGSLVLSGFSVIPSLTESDAGGTPNGDYFIPSNGALILDNPNVIVLVTADSYKEVNAAYGLTGGSDADYGVDVDDGSYEALSILGKVQVNDGYLSTRESAGIVTWIDASSQLIVNGGVVDAKQFRSGGTGAGKSSYMQSGGEFVLRGRFQRTPAAYAVPQDLAASTVATVNTARIGSQTDGTKAVFSLDDPSNVFSMSGGTIRIYDIVGGKAIDIFSSPGNISVSGGTVELVPTTGTGLGDAATWLLSSNAPFANLTIDRPSSTSVVQLNTGYPSLVVQNDLMLNTASFNANNLNVTVGGDFSISAGSTYTTGTNWTIMNGTGAQQLVANTAAALPLKRLKVDKPAGAVLTLAGSQPTITVADSLMIVKGTLNDGGKLVDMVPSATSTTSYLYNSGVHAGAGTLRLSDTDPQVIDGDGNGVFQNLELNNTNAAAAPVSLANGITVNGVLTLSQNKLFDIKTYGLRLNAAASIANPSASRYIVTAGNLGDGGITRVYSASSKAFVFPLGAASTRHATPVYSPATLTINGNPAAYGSITVNPVGYEHPATTTNGRTLTYFWRVKSSGLTLGAATVTHSYAYNQSDVVEVGIDPTEVGYVPARYLASTTSWAKGVAADVNEATNTIGGAFLTNVGFIDGDYTAGDDSPTSPFGLPKKYYSRQSGSWDSNSTWSLTGHSGAVAPSYPTSNDIVIIGGNDVVSLNKGTVAAPVPSSYVGGCASLQIEAGSTLDLFTYTTGTYGMVINHPNGNGLVRVTAPKVAVTSTPQFFSFPAGDFSDFNVNHGTTEYYDTDGKPGALYILPANVTSYGNLILTAYNGDNIVLPNTANVTINGDLTCTSSDNNNLSWICMSWNTNYASYGNSNAYNPTIEKTVRIKGKLNVLSGTLMYMDDRAPQHLIVEGDVTVAPANGNISCLVAGGGTPGGAPMANTMAIGGNLINNNNVTLRNGAYYCDLTFTGDNPTSLTNTSGAPVTVLNKLTIDKGTSQATTLTIDVAGSLSTLADSWLALKNGTLRYMRANPSSDFTISTTTPFSIPSTAGLYIDYANSGSRRILLANAASDVNDVYLDGKLTLKNGLVYVGNPGGTTNNSDIEYSGGGFSEIQVDGGSLFVNGQIRRNVSSTVGVLKYSQSAGNVTIYGNNPVAARAKLEVLNPGSLFDMSGGALTIVRGGGTTFGDLYLRPAAGSVTGGDIIFSQVPAGGTTIDAVQAFSMESNIVLNNLTVTGKTAATARNATLTLMVSPLTLKGGLTLSNTNSLLVANNRNVTIGGNFTNNGTYTYGANTTTFNGNTQAILGTSTSDFYNLVVSPVSTLSVSKSFTVNNDLTITSGSLNLVANKLTLLGDLVNNGAYTDNNSNGVVLQGTAKQQVSGNGSFGRLMLDNAAGAKCLSSISLQNDLVLSKGVLDINQYQLTLSQTSSIGGAPFDVTKMIVSDGVASNLGMRKFFASNPAAAFTFPIGVNGKYTPAILNITANSTVGYINVIPVNSNHPAVLDPNNVLHYYWKAESSGITGFKGSITYQYVAGDVVGGPEADYVAANLMLPGSFWSKATTGAATDNVNETLHQAKFNFNGVSNLSGDYTAGLDPALPDDVPSYRSVKNGDWTEVDTWEPVGASPSCPAGGPNGFNVIIDHEVTANANYCFAYQTTINGKLKLVSPFFGHNLGNVDGTGIVYLESGNLPAGNFDSFLDCSNNGTIEYGGNGSYTIIASQFNAVPNMLFSGTGSRILPAKDLTICRRFVISGPTVDNSVNNRKLTILGTIERYGAGVFAAGSGPNAIVSLSGTSPQTIGGSLGDFTGTSLFATLEVNNSTGVAIGANGSVITSKLLLTDGKIATAATNKLYVSGGPGAITPVAGSANSFVNGPLQARITPGSYFQYPVGKGNDLSHPFTVYSNAATTLWWTVEYFNPNPTYTSATAPLVDVNQTEYWKVKPEGIASAAAKVRIGWDSQSDLNPLMTLNGLSDLRVALYNTGSSSWVAQASSAAGTSTLGDVVNNAWITIPSASSSFTSASVSSTRPIASLNPGPSVCGSSGIPLKVVNYTPISFPYTITYSIDGAVQPPLTVNAMPYTIATNTYGEYKLLTFKYNGGASNGVVNTLTATAYAIPTTSNAGIDQSQCSSTHVFLNANDPAPYTAAWTIVSGAGGNVITPNSSSSEFIGIAGNTYTLRWTIVNGTCKSADDVVIAFPLTAQKPGAFTAAPKNVCQGTAGKTYTVPNQPGTVYTWSYSGGDVAIVGSGSSVNLNFGGASTSGTLSVTATNSCGATSDPRTVNITVIPPPTVTLDPISIPSGFTKPIGCATGSTVVKVTADAGQSYTWDLNSLGGFTPANGVDVSQITATWLDNATLFPASAPNPTTLDTAITVTVLNLGNGCSTTLSIPITIFRRVQTGPPYHVGNNVAQ
jgi:hypothetical protein